MLSLKSNYMFIILLLIVCGTSFSSSSVLVDTLKHKDSSSSESSSSESEEDDPIFEKKFADDPLDGSNHPCYRRCKVGDVRTCHYEFTLESYHTMSKACFNCPFNATDCARKDCIAADGVSRSITVVNRKMPGPKIEVCLGDIVIVDLHNALLDETTTIHWHGHHQRNTPYMDGAPFITQCPITVGSTFRYKFIAEHIGTHWWHSHTGVQRTDGAAGALIIREPRSVHKDLFDYDLSEHIMFIVDWYHDASSSIFTKNFHGGFDIRGQSLLVNGKGRFQQFYDKKPFYTPTAKFTVKKGFRYRFRIINAEFLVCPVELSIVGHNITVISTDGNDIEPVKAVSLVTSAAERFDIIINADQPIGNYLIMMRALVFCGPKYNAVKQVAVLHYEGAPDYEPKTVPSWEESYREGLQVNTINVSKGTPNSVTMAELTSVEPVDISLKEIPDLRLYIAYDMHIKDNTSFNKDPYYGINQVAPSLIARSPQFNKISMKTPSFALMPGRSQIVPGKHFCNESTVKNCDKQFCSCTHVINIPLNAVVEIVLIDEGESVDTNHPVHVHGYAFRVIAMKKLGNKTTREAVIKLDAEGKIERNLKGGPLKDTVAVPDGGYSVIRFVADNPGYWLYHCHIEFHYEMGMALVLKVGEHKDFLPTPKRFPTCGDYS